MVIWLTPPPPQLSMWFMYDPSLMVEFKMLVYLGFDPITLYTFLIHINYLKSFKCEKRQKQKWWKCKKATFRKAI